MIFRNRPTPKNAGQKLTDISLTNVKSNELWSELSETSETAVSGGQTLFVDTKPSDKMSNNFSGSLFNGGALISFDDRGNTNDKDFVDR
ncbi:hypothetical protein QUB33_03155 [Microcoleus sp. B3-A4]|uniref:hypothetical protein n=1 Tax=Microcoleus sp. B3-A4 TaxID=2818653 RepID=UPI002FD6E0D7